jgi:hypothetical protein
VLWANGWIGARHGCPCSVNFRDEAEYRDYDAAARFLAKREEQKPHTNNHDQSQRRSRDYIAARVDLPGYPIEVRMLGQFKKLRTWGGTLRLAGLHLLHRSRHQSTNRAVRTEASLRQRPDNP